MGGLAEKTRKISVSTVGRNRNFSGNDVIIKANSFIKSNIHLYCGDSLELYKIWEQPTVIVSDGGYGILGFQGDTVDHQTLPQWYEPHIAQWSKCVLPNTTLWFWNSEIGWAAVHPILEKYGWEYINCNVWNKGLGHIAGNINTSKIRRFPVVSELCVQYAYKVKINNLTIQEWLINEWKRSGIPFKRANEACGVKDAATRKYFDSGHLWYFPPPEMFEKIVCYANRYGKENGKPYFSIDGARPLSANEWNKMRYKFHCPHGFTNVWERSALRGKERIKSPLVTTKAAHLNQKPLDLMRLIIEASSDENDVIWEPFGGLFSASLAAVLTKRKAYAAEIDKAYFSLGMNRFENLSLFD
jgi:site-specific DNA-methyltransferase (adenine-specific)